MKRLLSLSLLTIVCSVSASAKNESPIVVTWPVDNPALKLTFDPFRQQSNVPGQNFYVTDVTVENLTDKAIPSVSFTVYFLDKDRVRIGQSPLAVSDLDAHQAAKVQFQFNSVGVPASLALSAKKDMLEAKTIPLRIISVPPGANLKVDGRDAGMTPVMIRVAVGTHQLELAKEGYSPGTTPLDVTPDELPGGSITIELGGLSRDTVELRDGTVVLGDVISMSMTSVVMRADGKDQTYDRNQVKKIMLVERLATPQPVKVQPAATQPHR